MSDIPEGTRCRTQPYEGGFKTPPLYKRELAIVKKNKNGCYTVRDVKNNETAVVPKKGLVLSTTRVIHHE